MKQDHRKYNLFASPPKSIFPNFNQKNGSIKNTRPITTANLCSLIISKTLKNIFFHYTLY
jgi:hypothetical protein